MVLRGLVLLCPLPPSGYCCTFRFDGGREGMILRCRVLLCPLTPLDTTVFSCATSLSRDTAVLSRFDGWGEGMVLRGLVLWRPLPPSRYCCILLWVLVYV